MTGNREHALALGYQMVRSEELSPPLWVPIGGKRAPKPLNTFHLAPCACIAVGVFGKMSKQVFQGFCLKT